MESYNLVVIGSGVAATTAAKKVRAAGWRVCVVEERELGGTCALRGCDPKKVLYNAARALDFAKRQRGIGVEGELRIDWPALSARKREFTEGVPEHRRSSFAEAGIDCIEGEARFVASNRLAVGERELEAEYILIASGAAPSPLPFPGSEHLASSDDFLALSELPRRIVFVGGGYIACELAGIARRAGAEVNIIEHGERLLKHFDPDLVAWLSTNLEQQGIELDTHTEVKSLEKKGSAYRLQLASGHFSRELEADMVVHSAGRRPALDSLDLEAGGVASRDGRLDLNQFLQSTSNDSVFAAGDAAQKGPPLTPVSNHDGELVAANILMGTHRRADYRGVPQVAFTLPPIARVGLGEDEAREQGLRYRCHFKDAAAWFTARAEGENTYGFKILEDEEHHRLLGAHLIGPDADEVINLFALSIRHNLTIGQLKANLFTYPSAASDIGSMLDA